MYGFRKKEVAEHLRDFSEDATRYKPHEGMKVQALKEENTKIVRVAAPSGFVAGVSDPVGGLVNAEENSVYPTWNNMEEFGNYLADFAYCNELWFEPMENPRQGDNLDVGPNGQFIRSTLKPTSSYVNNWTQGVDWRTGGDITDRSDLIVHNFCPLPLTMGQIIVANRIGRRWVYTGSHQVFADTNISTISSETYGTVTVRHYPYTANTAFDFDSPAASQTSSIEVSAYNPWDAEVPAGKKCILGIVSSRITIMGWEC